MRTARKTRDRVLILRGGYAGGYVARLLDSGPTVGRSARLHDT